MVWTRFAATGPEHLIVTELTMYIKVISDLNRSKILTILTFHYGFYGPVATKTAC